MAKKVSEREEAGQAGLPVRDIILDIILETMKLVTPGINSEIRLVPNEDLMQRWIDVLNQRHQLNLAIRDLYILSTPYRIAAMLEMQLQLYQK
jgi:hypothetical protein